VFCTVLALGWWLWARTMRPLPVIEVREYEIGEDVDIDGLRAQLMSLPGAREATIEAERRIASVKVNLELWDEARVRRLLGLPAAAH
jgi:hypothetical protein